ncbi:MAG: hypothetical protein H6977_06930 [Gammaproteobacteria bacterium]|nr:hypothetical protein [Gammaproteobacteria bacterium]MCP5199727.1 hypothetical protein [Gammaproteobacteria bacterium]
MERRQTRDRWQTGFPAGILFITVLALFASGCASLASPPREAVAAHEPSRAERIFLYQSRVADALLDRYPLLEVFEEADPALIAAEAKMTENCSPLTRAVLARLEGSSPSLGLRFKVFTTLDDCERAARRIDKLLNGDTSLADAI